jgi:short-subunit dehydrogenase
VPKARDPKHVLITGASSGIGAVLAEKLAMPGRLLVLVGRDATRLGGVVSVCQQAGASCRGVVLDIRDRQRLAALFADCATEAPLDLLIANAGILDGRGEDQLVETAETARRVLSTNLLSTIDTVHLVLPGMMERGAGSIILVSSLAAFVPLPDAPAYSASKSGLLAYGLALRDALRSTGVDVVTACPGFVATPMANQHLGPRPGEISAEAAAEQILQGWRRNRPVIGFPLTPFWLSRLSLLVPESIRRYGMRSTRFHVG